MHTSQTLEALRHLACSPASHAACYEARRLLDALPLPAERAEAERYLLNAWGEPPAATLPHLIERHASSLVLGGVDLTEPRFTQGPFTFHVYLSEPVRDGAALGDDLKALPEPARRRRDIKALLRSLTPDALRSLLDDPGEEDPDEPPLHTLRGEELTDALLDLGLYDLLDGYGTAFPCVARADTVEDLLREVRRLRLVAWFQEDEPLPPLRQDEAHLQPIEDPDLLTFARELHGAVQLMGMSTDLSSLYYCRHILLRRPGAELLFGWDAIPHRQEEGWAILRWG